MYSGIQTGEVVAIEPKGWSEAMGLGEDEFDAWEGPNQSEIAKDVAVDVSALGRIPTNFGDLLFQT